MLQIVVWQFTHHLGTIHQGRRAELSKILVHLPGLEVRLSIQVRCHDKGEPIALTAGQKDHVCRDELPVPHKKDVADLHIVPPDRLRVLRVPPRPLGHHVGDPVVLDIVGTVPIEVWKRIEGGKREGCRHCKWQGVVTHRKGGIFTLSAHSLTFNSVFHSSDKKHEE